ncbi:MAG: hypothetical protein COT17_02590 [Elusimicrobia bacterium CG08_land_8_20_14_0_20_51_18]|nr:MAG: hypothetical protein COT17_02590 [Elusimicrobia bacterium CG08_land_8_20_14_0_20_51_18]
MRIKIADIILSFGFPAENPAFLREAGERYGGFLTREKTAPDLFFSVRLKKLKKEPFRPSITLEKNLLKINRGDFFCEADLKKKRGALLLNPSVYSLDSFLRVLISVLLNKKNGLLVHAAALSFKKGAWLLAGKSGSGKSTLSRLAAGKAFILSDELVPLRINKKGVTVFSSPFWGEMRGRGEAFEKNLKGLCLLKKSTENLKTPAGEAEFAGTFLRCVMNFSKAPEISEKAVKKTAALWRLLRPQNLYFSKKDDGFLKLL